MNKLILILLFHASAQIATAQTSKVIGQAAQQNLNELTSTNNLNGVINTYDNRYEGVRGTPFNSNSWGTATVTSNGVVYQNMIIKYNVYENNLLLNKNNTLLLLDINKIDSFVFTDSLRLKSNTFKRVSSMTKINPKIDKKFAVVLFEGEKVKLINLPDKILIKADYKGTYSSGKTYDEFIDENTVFFIDRNHNAQKVKLNKKSLIKNLNDQAELVKEFILKEKIDASTEAGWIKTLAYYETL